MIPKSSAMKRGSALRAGSCRPRCCRRGHRRGRSCRGTPAGRTRARPWRPAPGGRCRRRPARRCRRTGCRARAPASARARRCGSRSPRARTGPASPASCAAAGWRCRLRAAGRARRRGCSRSRRRSRAGGSCRRSGGCARPAPATFFSRAMSAAICAGDVRAQHLDHHLAAVVQRRGMHLGDARRRPAAWCRSSRTPRRCGGPAPARRCARACSPSNGATRSCSSVSSSAMSGGTRSRRVDRICPNLTKIGPSSCSARRRRAPRDCAAICGARRAARTGASACSQRSAGVSSSRSSSR